MARSPEPGDQQPHRAVPASPPFPLLSASSLRASPLVSPRAVFRRMELVGEPSAETAYVFNGDFVDRGAWGLETFLLLAGWKLACPRHVFLLRGNHETALCSMVYGFKGELVAKLGSKWKVRWGGGG